jgi:phospholipid transport system substrate-binding protein
MVGPWAAQLSLNGDIATAVPGSVPLPIASGFCDENHASTSEINELCDPFRDRKQLETGIFPARCAPDPAQVSPQTDNVYGFPEGRVKMPRRFDPIQRLRGNLMALRILVPVLILLVFAPAGAADFSTPMGRVKDSIERVVSVLKDPSLDREARWQQIAAVIDQGFDFRSMSQSVLATHWKEATPEERERFIEYFSQYIEEVYRSKIEAYTDQEIRYGAESIRDDRAVVETVIVTSAAEIPVNFKLKRNDGQWYAYDVVIEGVSLVANYRDTFSTIVKNEGMEGLLADIQDRIERHRQELREPGALPAPKI